MSTRDVSRMHPFLRFLSLFGIFAATSIAWIVLGATTESRGHESRDSTSRGVAGLWGQPQRQAAPSFALVEFVDRDLETSLVRDGRTERVVERRRERVEVPTSPSSTRVDARFHLDRRRRGLVWYDLYDVVFDGTWVFEHASTKASTLRIVYAFPDENGLYDGFRFEVDGKTPDEVRRPSGGVVAYEMPVAPGQRVTLRIGYASRGMGSFAYVPGTGVTSARDFELAMRTDFLDVDFPPEGLSPTTRRREGRGEKLVWRFDHVITGRTMGLVMPTPIQPGELASALAFSAPVSLFFFLLVLESASRRRGIALHPLHFAFLAGAFFAFHLLFSYSADHLEVVPAFVLSSVTSVVLVIAYLRILVSTRFAFVEAGLAQLVYLVGFALAHFAKGFTGLTVTVLAIVTLFVLMQWNARDDRDAIARSPSAPGGEPSGTSLAT